MFSFYRSGNTIHLFYFNGKDVCVGEFLVTLFQDSWFNVLKTCEWSDAIVFTLRALQIVGAKYTLKINLTVY